MDAADVKWLDFQRILFGTAPISFLGEACIRSLLMYASLLITLRLLGKGMNGMMSLIELSVMLVLGAIVSVPMEMPERGLIPGVVLLLGVLGLQKLLGLLCLWYKPVERIVIGGPAILIRDGAIDLDAVRRQGITENQILTDLRQRGYLLEEVERMYLEANGKVSIMRWQRDGHPIS